MFNYPKLNIKEAEKLLIDNDFVLDRHMSLPNHPEEILHPKIIKKMFGIIKKSKE